MPRLSQKISDTLPLTDNTAPQAIACCSPLSFVASADMITTWCDAIAKIIKLRRYSPTRSTLTPITPKFKKAISPLMSLIYGVTKIAIACLIVGLRLLKRMEDNQKQLTIHAFPKSYGFYPMVQLPIN